MVSATVLIYAFAIVGGLLRIALYLFVMDKHQLIFLCVLMAKVYVFRRTTAYAMRDILEINVKFPYAME